ncbi:MAG: helix-turn-helix domain-containing protein [Pseudomonadota bacterium]
MTGQSDNEKLFHCPALSALKVISGKWKTRILWLLRERSYHFGELKRTLPGVTAKVLSEQLKQLENAGILAQQNTMIGSVHYCHYGFSKYGRSLIPVLEALGNWGLDHAKQNEP